MDAERVAALTGKELSGLIDALLDAYIAPDDFEMLLTLNLDKPSGTFPSDGGLKACVFKLVRAARSEGWLTELINAAIKERPSNAKLRQWAEAVNRVLAAPAVLQETPPLDAESSDRAEHSGSEGLQPIHNLGPRPDLIGRAPDLQALLKKMSNVKQPLILVGPPGIGKSSLAIESAYRVSRPHRTDPPFRPYEFVLFFTARLEPFALPALLDEIARWTDNVYIMKFAEVAQKLIEVRKLLARTRVLLILDNLESVSDQDVFEFIEAVPFPSQVVGTSRRRHPELAIVSHIELPAISTKSSNQLLQRELGTIPGRGSSFEAVRTRAPALIHKLEAITLGNPLAIKWAAAQLRAMPIDSLLASLESGHGDLFSKMFEKTWHRLSVDSRTALVTMTFFKTPPTIHTALDLAKVQPSSEGVITELSNSGLMEPSAGLSGVESGRITLHPLTLAFASAKLAEFPDDRRRQLRLSYIYYYESSIGQAGGRDWDDPKPFEATDDERDNYIQAIMLAEAERQWSSVIAIVDGLRNYLLIYGYWSLRLQLCNLALRAAQSLNDQKAYAQFMRHVGWTMVLQGNLGEAATNLDEALSIAVREGYLKVQADATGDLAEIARLTGDLQRARALRSESLRLSRVGGNQRDIYVEQTLLAQMDLDERRLAAAREGFLTSMQLAQQLRWHRAIAYCLHWLGEVARLEGDYELARRYLSHSREYLAPFRDRARLALILKSEALLIAAQGDMSKARAIAEQATSELKKLGLPYELRELESLVNLSNIANNRA